MALASSVERIVDLLAGVSPERASFAPHAVRGTLLEGSGGVALFLLEAARVRAEPELLSAAERWWRVADDWSSRAGPAEWRGFAGGVVLGDGGLALVDALLGAGTFDPKRVHRAVERLERASQRIQLARASELFGGFGGLLLATRALAARIPPGLEYEGSREALRRLEDRARSVVLEAQRQPLDPEDDAQHGLAHGYAGDLFALAIAGDGDDPAFRARATHLHDLRQMDTEGLTYWWVRRGEWSPSMLASLCNGTAGHTILWTEIARRTGDANAAELARAAAVTTAALPALNATLCCGAAGQALALQRYAAWSGERAFARRAYALLARAAEWAANEEALEAVLPLWQGALGVALVAMNRLAGDSSLPVFEVPAARP